jgi:glutamine synthetase
MVIYLSTNIFEKISKENIKYVNLLFTNLIGKLHILQIPVEELDDAIKFGIGFDGSSAGLTTIEKSDLLLKPDPNTFVPALWESEPKTGIMIAEVFSYEKPFEMDPRNILKKAISKLKRELGDNVEYMVSPEIEFWLFKFDEGRLTFHDDASYFTIPPRDKGYEIRKSIAEILNKIGIQPVKIHHEVPPSKHEIDFKFGPALRIADASILYKFVVKNVASKYGLTASFMPKPFHGTYGAGMHTHQSLYDTRNDENLFYGTHDGLSELALYFIGGLIKHAREITVLTNPTVNSYKRLVPGWEAPVYISWAKFNRSALIRVPMTNDPKKVRIEYRGTDGSCNPYIAFAAMLLAGLDGILNKINPPPPIEENIYKMSWDEREKRGILSTPSSLEEALKEAEKSQLIKEILGISAFKYFMETKWNEWKEFSTTVHEWERQKYFDI